MKLDLSLAEIQEETDAVTCDVQSTFGHLNAEQLNWKANADSWSVAQCLEHLIVINGQMLSAIDPVINGINRTRLLERLPFWPSLCGRMMIKIVAPQGTKKFKAPPTAVPSASKLDPQIVNQFADHQNEVMERVKAIQNRGLANIIMASPFAGFITYSLLDACRIIAVHERRHFEQAKRVMAAKGFPQS